MSLLYPLQKNTKKPQSGLFKHINSSLFAQIHFSSGVQFVELVVFQIVDNKMLSPVDFISGPNALFTLWNLLKEKTGCLTAYPFNCALKTKSAGFIVA
jgi:hypothetical protein